MEKSLQARTKERAYAAEKGDEASEVEGVRSRFTPVQVKGRRKQRQVSTRPLRRDFASAWRATSSCLSIAVRARIAYR